MGWVNDKGANSAPQFKKGGKVQPEGPPLEALKKRKRRKKIQDALEKSKTKGKAWEKYKSGGRE